jgi:hypothetical protein
MNSSTTLHCVHVHLLMHRPVQVFEVGSDQLCKLPLSMPTTTQSIPNYARLLKLNSLQSPGVSKLHILSLAHRKISCH